MKTKFTLLGLALFSLNIQAQVTLTKANIPAYGTRYIKYDANVPSPEFTFSKTGTTNTWDFTTISPLPTQEDTIYYKAAADVEGASNFPGADLVSYEKGDKTFNFVKVQDNGIFLLGIYGDFIGNGYKIAIPAQSPILAFPFPLNSSTSYSGSPITQYKTTGAALGYSGLVDSVWLYLRTYANVQVLASGTLKIPSGTYPSILERSITKTVDSVRVKVPNIGWNVVKADTETVVTYKWYTQESIEPYAHVIMKKGAITDVNFHKSFGTPLGLRSETLAGSSLNCYPNPARESVTIDIESGMVDRISVLSVAGNELFTSSTPTLNISVLQPGMYVAKTILKNGSYKLTTFVKN